MFQNKKNSAEKFLLSDFNEIIREVAKYPASVQVDVANRVLDYINKADKEITDAQGSDRKRAISAYLSETAKARRQALAAGASNEGDLRYAIPAIIETLIFARWSECRKPIAKKVFGLFGAWVNAATKTSDREIFSGLEINR